MEKEMKKKLTKYGLLVLIFVGGLFANSATHVAEKLIDLVFFAGQAEDLRVSVLSFKTIEDPDNKDEKVLCSEILFVNNGNRPATIPGITLELSETPSFDLVVGHTWRQDRALILESQKTTQKTIMLGQYSLSKTIYDVPNNPSIYTRMNLDVIDSSLNLHRITINLPTIKRKQDGFTTYTRSDFFPMKIVLLPSTQPPPPQGSQIYPLHKGAYCFVRFQGPTHAFFKRSGPLGWQITLGDEEIKEGSAEH